MAQNKIVVYTCITGGYDSLREIRYVSPSIDYICFTDNTNLKSKTWKIKPIPSDLKNLSIVKQQRVLKVLPHKYLSEYQVSLWVDSNIEIISDLKDFFSKYPLDKKFLYTNKHPTRDCIYREQLAVLRLNKDTFENTNPQINRYKDEGFPEHYGLAETNIMLRLHNSTKCIKLMNAWGEEILKGSHRDQLSFNYTIWKNAVKDEVDYFNEKYYNLHISDNAFFKLNKHIRISNGVVKPFIDEPKKQEPTISLIKEEPKKKIHIETKKLEIPQKQVPPKEIKKEEAPKENDPCVSVVIFTHNRTNVAKETIKSLIKNLKYTNLKWILSDDRSDKGHIEELLNVFKAEGNIAPVVCKTDNKRFGLGASMNNGIKEAFKYSDVVLRVEDDWILQKELFLKQHEQVLRNNSNVGGIRIGMVGGGVNQKDLQYSNVNYKQLIGTDKNSWLFCNQVAIIHKRLHDKLGWYKENVGADKEEEDFRNRYNQLTNNGSEKLLLLVPSEMKWRTFDDSSLWFIHVGRSSLGHVIYHEPSRYSWIYKNDSKLPAKKAIQIKEVEKFDVIYVLGNGSINNNEELRYSLRSIEKNLVGLDHVFVVGANPGYLSDKVIHIPCEDPYPCNEANKDRNIWHKLYAAVKDPRLNERFLYAFDDFILIKKCTWEDFYPSRGPKVTQQYLNSAKNAPSAWRINRINTYKRFNTNDIYFWDAHMFSQMTKTKFLKCIADVDYQHRSDVIVQTYYYSHEPKEKSNKVNNKVVELRQVSDIDKAFSSYSMISYIDKIYADSKFKNKLNDLFSTKSKYEKTDIVENKASNIDLSIIIPVYNSEPWLFECITSITSQWNERVEIICIDDNSTDKSFKILTQFKEKYPQISIIKHDKNTGPSVGRNQGITQAKGKYIWFVDSDDVVLNKSLDKILELIKKNPALIYFNSEVFFDNNKIKDRWKANYKKDRYYRKYATNKLENKLDFFVKNIYYPEILSSTCMQIINKKYLISNGITFNKDIWFGEDKLFSLDIFLADLINTQDTKSTIYSTTSSFYNRRIREGSLVTKSKKKDKRYIDNLNKLISELKNRKKFCNVKQINLLIDSLISMYERWKKV